MQRHCVETKRPNSEKQDDDAVMRPLAHVLCRISGYAYGEAVYYDRARQVITELEVAGYVIVPKAAIDAALRREDAPV